ncbi:DUF2207 domain-containing protein [Bacillus sp. JJ722]|uniref:DUF2207 domain-containing protein n=1 Tax=Bacillus sp. JJ722 TaxID=3122973 RepID=UPI00300005D8
MAKGIKGITIEIGGNTGPLDKALSDVNKKSRDLQGELRQVERLLKFDPGNAELVAQKQEILANQVENTSNKLETLRQAQAQVEAQFQNGDIGVEQYRAFQREVISTENTLNKLKNQLNNTAEAHKEMEDKSRQLETLLKATDLSAEQLSSTLGSELVNAIKNGTASSKQLDTAIEKIGQAALGASIDLDKLKIALKSADDGASLKSVRKDLAEVSKEAQKAGADVNGFGMELQDVAAGLAAGGGIAAAISTALDTSTLDTKIEISMEVPESSQQSVKEAINTVSAYGVDAEAALEGVRRQWALNKDASDESNAAVVKGAATIATAYSGIDFNELIQETNEIASELKISNEEALGLTDSLLRVGFPPEQLDIIAEYGGQLQRAGFDAQEIQGIMAAGIETGTWNIDNLLDGLKEGRIRLVEFGTEVPKAMQDVLKGTEISAQQMQEWGQAVAKGGEEGSAAMVEVAKALMNVEDQTKRNELGVAIFGTMYEDQGQNIIDTLLNAKGATVDLKTSQDELNESTSKLDKDPTVTMRKAFADLKVAMEPILTTIAEVIAKIAEWVSNNPKLAATITAVVMAIGTLVSIGIALSPVFLAITAAATPLMAGIAGIALPIAGVIAAISALIAIGIALYKNWDEIKEYASIAWEAIKSTISAAWEAIKSVTSSMWESITSFLSGAWEGIVSLCSSIWEGIKAFFSSTWEGIKSTTESVWNGISSFLSGMWEGIKSIAVTIWDGIKLYFTTVLNAYKLLFTTIWNAIKTVVETVWNAMKMSATTIWEGIKTFFTSTLNAIKTTFTTIWNAIKSVVETVWNGLKTSATTIWNGIKAFFTSTLNAIKSTFTTIWNGIKTTVLNVWNTLKSSATSIWNSIKSSLTSILNSIKSTFTSIWNSIKSTVTSVTNAMKTTINSVWNSIKSTTTSIWNSIKNAISKPINAAKDAVNTAIEKIKDIMDFDWKLPKLKLPHFSISGDFSLKPPSVPKIGVDWYDKGGIFYGPQIIGVGEKRPEFVGALEDLHAIVKGAMSEVVIGNMTGATRSNITNNTPINVVLNYQGNTPIQDAMEMVDIVELELNHRYNSRLRMSGVKK